MWTSVVAGAVLLLGTEVQGDDLKWVVAGDTMVSAEGGLRVDAAENVWRKSTPDGIRLGGDGTPFTVVKRADGSETIPRDAITVEAWASISSPEQWGGILSAIQDNGEAESGIVLGYDHSVPYFGLASTGADDGDGKITYLRSSTPYKSGRWHHFVGTYDGETMRIYLDGEEVGTSSEQSGPILFTGAEPLVLGGYRDINENQGLDGRLLEASILPRAINAAEVKERFQVHKNLIGQPPRVNTDFAWVVPPFLTWPTTDAISVVGETSSPSAMNIEVRSEDGAFRKVWRHDEPATLHEFRLEGLAPHTKYFYRVRAENEEFMIDGGRRTFRTAAAPGDAFSFVAIGDTQSHPEVVKRVSDLAYETRPNLLVHAGDLVDTGGRKTDWTEHFFPNMRPLIEYVPMMPVLGNHEQDAKLYYDYMSLPQPERWYAFRYGDAEFFMLDGNRSFADQSAQMDWLVKTLAASTATWKIAILHQPPWTSDSDDYGDTTRTSSSRGDLNARNIVKVLEKYGVDICMSGHVHDYERTFPIRDGKVVPWEEGGVIYVTCAGGGGHLENFDSANTFFGHRKARRHHLVYCGIHGGILEFQAIDEDGRLFDVFTLDKRDGKREIDQSAELDSHGDDHHDH